MQTEHVQQCTPNKITIKVLEENCDSTKGSFRYEIEINLKVINRISFCIIYLYKLQKIYFSYSFKKARSCKKAINKRRDSKMVPQKKL